MRRNLQTKLIEWTITTLGFLALFTPLALWAAWSKPVFYLVLVIGCGAILLIYILALVVPDHVSGPEPDDRLRRGNNDGL